MSSHNIQNWNQVEKWFNENTKNKIIPKNVCRTFLKNDTCEQTLTEYLLTGIEEDEELEEDINKCTMVEGSKIIKCRRAEADSINPLLNESIVGGTPESKGVTESKGGTAESKGVTAESKGGTAESNIGNAESNIGNAESKDTPTPSIKKNENYKKYKIVLKRLIQINIYLRRYKIPKKIIVKLIKKINDINILNEMIKIYEIFVKANDNFDYAGDNTNIKSTCDQRITSNDTSNIKNDCRHPDVIDLHYDAKTYDANCPSCSRWLQFYNVVNQYYYLSIHSLYGTNGLESLFSILKIMQSIVDNDNINVVLIKDAIGLILGNINCRSDLYKIMKKRANELEK